ncbi:MAG: hypothetical protein WCC29_02255 [Pseudomonas farsensis]|uniref:hypothetical protein n=1 Tax=Pseudomonas farsensis TaxID=2745492 RepID=UPI003C7B40E7
MHAPPSVAGCGMVAIWSVLGYYEGPAWSRFKERKMAVAVEDYEENTQIYEKAVKITDNGLQYVLSAADGSILAVIPKDEVKKIHSDI